MIPFDALLALLIEATGSPSWTEREAATTALSHLHLFAVPALQRAESHPDAEVRRRVRTLLEDAHRFGPCPMVWVDMLPEGFPERNEVVRRCLDASGWLSGEGCNAPLDWLVYRQATLHLLAELHAAGWSRERQLLLLDEMASRQNDWLARHMIPRLLHGLPVLAP